MRHGAKSVITGDCSVLPYRGCNLEDVLFICVRRPIARRDRQSAGLCLYRSGPAGNWRSTKTQGVRDSLVNSISAFEWSNRNLHQGNIVPQGPRGSHQSESTHLTLRSSGADEASSGEKRASSRQSYCWSLQEARIGCEPWETTNLPRHPNADHL